MTASSKIRFATVRDLYAAFPTAEVDVGVESCDEPSADFVSRLTKEGERRAALSYCAYLLARREAVWWAARCVRQTAPEDAVSRRCLQAADEWVTEPSEARRRRALEEAAQAQKSLAAAWVAQAAGWSGGNVSPNPAYFLEPPPQATAQAARGAVLIALGALSPERRDAAQVEWIEAGLCCAVGDLGRS
ncbi:hypothetical protein IY145_08955 [Methylosinus sp. H3A]|uniref:DUF6931 family protein n=1 Tax=Methylosinus sp. H3A TaxID=2785786 RepID=UPI0018C310A1|nr:hypothetical protein [Methylosinus sp. H3A]MBG0809507.1 hypothetical protein [Methylosinus sp. H3A]